MPWFSSLFLSYEKLGKKKNPTKQHGKSLGMLGLILFFSKWADLIYFYFDLLSSFPILGTEKTRMTAKKERMSKQEKSPNSNPGKTTPDILLLIQSEFGIVLNY